MFLDLFREACAHGEGNSVFHVVLPKATHLILSYKELLFLWFQKSIWFLIIFYFANEDCSITVSDCNRFLIEFVGATVCN